MSERTPTDPFTEVVLYHMRSDPELLHLVLPYVGLGRPDEDTGDVLHLWVADNDPQKDDPTLYSELAILALGLMNWSEIAASLREALESVTEARIRPVAHQIPLLDIGESTTGNPTSEVSNPLSSPSGEH